jgi:hypothetical protein
MIQKNNNEELNNNLDDFDDENFNLDNIDDDIVDDIDYVESIEDDISNDDSEDDIVDDDVDIMFKFNTNNHKIEGKHSLTRDTIFKGKIEDNNEQSEYFSTQDDFSLDGLPIEVGTSYEFESKYNEEYIGRLNLSKDVYDLLSEKTELDFSLNRRKPNRQSFNDYYKMLLDNIGKDYTKSEIFVELSYYFTDNIFNMFKLLDKEYATQIIVELKQSGYLSNLNNINFI